MVGGSVNATLRTTALAEDNSDYQYKEEATTKLIHGCCIPEVSSSNDDDDDDEIAGLHTLVVLTTGASRAGTMALRPREWRKVACLSEVYDVEQELLKQTTASGDVDRSLYSTPVES
jgi:hypothetical protein